MHDFVLTVEDIDVVFEFTSHALKRANLRSIQLTEVRLLLRRASHHLLDFKVGEEILVYDSTLHCGAVIALSMSGLDVLVKVVTVVRTPDPFVRRGTRLFCLEEMSYA